MIHDYIICAKAISNFNVTVVRRRILLVTEKSKEDRAKVGGGRAASYALLGAVARLADG